MKPDPKLMIPGPTPVPPDILEALAMHPIGHRSKAFQAILEQVYPRLSWLFQTKRPVYLYTASGTGAMEAALQNTLNPDDDILVLSCGVFSERWAGIAQTLGLQVYKHTVPFGEPSRAEELEAFLKTDAGKQVKAVCMIHNETSTSVINPLQELIGVIKANSDALIVVDTVTSLGATEFLFDEWGVDMAVSGSQKGFMLPPGLAFIAVSEKAMAAHKQCKTPGYYFNFSAYEKSQANGQTPYTPAVTLIQGLHVALERMESEGLEAIWKRHHTNQKMVRQAAKAIGLEHLVQEEEYASPSVTALLPPADVSVDAIRAGLLKQHSITVANGQKDLKGKIFRIGHLGAIYPRDILGTLGCLEIVLHQAGHSFELGAGVGAAQTVLAQQPEVATAHG